MQLTNTRRIITTLCGSTKFRDDFMKANARLTMEGRMVASFADGKVPPL